MNEHYKPLVIVEVDDRVWRDCTLQYLPEGVWHRHGDLMIRVDPPRPEMHIRRHVHIAEPKHTSAKGKQVSWNDDGSRHDRGSFDARFPKMGAAHDIARNALGVGSEVVFEEISAPQHLKIIVEAILSDSDVAPRDYIEPLFLRATVTKKS